MVALEELFVRDVAQHARQGHAGETGANGFVVERATGHGDTVKPHAFEDELFQRHFHVTHTGLDRLRTVGLFEVVRGDAATEAQGGLDVLAEFRPLGFGADGDIHSGGRTFGAEGLQHLLGDDFGSPACFDGFAFDFREFAVADFLDSGNAISLGLDGALGGLFSCGLNVGLRLGLDFGGLFRGFLRFRKIGFGSHLRGFLHAVGRIGFFFDVHCFSFDIVEFELRVHMHPGRGICPDSDDGNFPQNRFCYEVERPFDHLSVDLAFCFDQLAFFDVGPNGELPVGSAFALGDDVVCRLGVGNDFPDDFQNAVLDACFYHPDAGVGPVLVIGQERHRFRDFHSGKLDDDRMFPAGQIHLSAGVCQTGHLRSSAAGCFNQFEFSHPVSPLFYC